MAAISKKFYFDVLDDIVNKYNNTVHRTIKMKPIDVTDDSYAEYNENPNKKDPKFKVGDYVRISKYFFFLVTFFFLFNIIYNREAYFLLVAIICCI